MSQNETELDNNAEYQHSNFYQITKSNEDILQKLLLIQIIQSRTLKLVNPNLDCLLIPEAHNLYENFNY